ncbi:hypothetical protein KIK84_14720 [Curvibacter sp. CHRR-16]|uniref:hypothetical protein n=1 Tax=Curvibacter sp. CHRR-16 TaxID=2835872 RepID=UPI001BDACE1C|nr:hypothetical protein [Curvibacter sp. CHRR-16]MBT0571578.1 hypothetical protein [Curvibacter sp. CHRR-16]
MAISPVRDASAVQRSSDIQPAQMQERIYALTNGAPAGWTTSDTDDENAADAHGVSAQDAVISSQADAGSAYQLLGPGISTLQFAQWHNPEDEDDNVTQAVLIEHSISTIEQISVTPIEIRQ